jgi:hypothetical protein
MKRATSVDVLPFPRKHRDQRGGESGVSGEACLTSHLDALERPTEVPTSHMTSKLHHPYDHNMRTVVSLHEPEADHIRDIISWSSA